MGIQLEALPLGAYQTLWTPDHGNPFPLQLDFWNIAHESQPDLVVWVSGSLNTPNSVFSSGAWTLFFTVGSFSMSRKLAGTNHI